MKKTARFLVASGSWFVSPFWRSFLARQVLTEDKHRAAAKTEGRAGAVSAAD